MSDSSDDPPKLNTCKDCIFVDLHDNMKCSKTRKKITENTVACQDYDELPF